MHTPSIIETSSVTQLARTNAPPDDKEIHAIQTILKQPQLELDALSEELRQLQSAVIKLQAKQRRLRKDIQPLQAITSPVRRLPDDILQEIFLWCLPKEHYPTLDPLEAPLVLTHLCRRWRFVASNTRRLWSSIHIPLPVLHIPSQSIPLIYAEDERHKLKAKFTKTADAFVQTIETWIGRIGGCGLSFSLYQADHQNREEDGCLHAVMEILIRRSQQWERVDIAAPLRSVGAVVSLGPEDVPRMKCLTTCSTSRHALALRNRGGFPFALGGPAPVAESLPSWRQSRIFEAPHLKSLCLLRLDEPLLSMPIEWSKLTSLVIEKQGTVADFGFVQRGIAIDVPLLASLLRQCTMLMHARLALTPGTPEPHRNHESLVSPIELPNLVSLAFFEDRTCSGNLFRIIDAPNLRKLEFQTLRKPEPDHGPLGSAGSSFSLLPFLRRFGPKIEELTIDTQFILPFDRVKCWEMLTGLRVLKLAPSTFSSVKYPGDEQGLLPFTNCDLQQLLVPFSPADGPSSPRCHVMPHLKSLECTTLSTLSDRGVLEFVKERKRSGMKSAKLGYEKDWDKPVDGFVDAMESHRCGMDIELQKKIRPSFVHPKHGLKYT